MGLLENSIGAMFGRGPGDNDGPSFGASPYAPMATALIGLLAAKAMSGGFGNLGGLFGGGQQAQPPQNTAPQAGYGQQGYSQPAPDPQGAGGLLGGLGGLLHQFQQSGHGDLAQSWVGSGPNQQATPNQVGQALGPEILQQMMQRTGLNQQQVLQQLSQELPELINRLTPQGRLPSHDEASSFLNGGNPLQPR